MIVVYLAAPALVTTASDAGGSAPGKRGGDRADGRPAHGPRPARDHDGTTVNGENSEAVDYPVVGGSHEVVADDGSWASPPLARWSRRFDQPGAFTYHCQQPPGATGQIVVTGEPVRDRPAEQEVAITEDPRRPHDVGLPPA